MKSLPPQPQKRLEYPFAFLKASVEKAVVPPKIVA